ncbi:hypothetical protein [Aeromonas salmonicida]|uniref:hypothetical protein n=1 Tax=Aeromonas salmonicida TaxID=645 RepID=UPI003D2600E0
MTFLIVMWLQLLIVAADPQHRQRSGRKPGNHRPHYSADDQRGIAPPNLLQRQATTQFQLKLANPNKIKGHGKPVPNHRDLLSWRIKRRFS